MIFSKYGKKNATSDTTSVCSERMPTRFASVTKYHFSLVFL